MGNIKFIGTSNGDTPVEAWSTVMAGNTISAYRKVSVPPEVAPEAFVLTKILAVIAVVVVPAAVATSINRTRSTHEPLAPAVVSKKMSVPMVPPPAEEVLAADGFAWPIRPTLENIGDVFPGIKLRGYVCAGNHVIETD